MSTLERRRGPAGHLVNNPGQGLAREWQAERAQAIDDLQEETPESREATAEDVLSQR